MLAVHNTSQCAGPAHLGVEHAECRAQRAQALGLPQD